MGYRLRFDGVNDYCQFGSSMSIDIGTTAYTFEAKFILNAVPSGIGGLLGRNGTAAGFFVTSTRNLAVYTGGTNRYQTASNFILNDGAVHTYRLEHDAGGAWRAYRDGSLVESGTFTLSTTAAPLIWIGQGNNGSNTFCSMDLEYLEVTGPTNAQKWDANLSGGTGTTLPTTSGTNQATLINFPTDNSQWIIFSSGTAYTDTLSGFSITSSIGSLSSATSYDSLLSGVSLTSSVNSIASSVARSSMLNSFSSSSSIGDLVSTITNGSQNYEDTLSGFSISSSVGDLVSAVSRGSVLLGMTAASSIGSMQSTLSYSSTLSGLTLSSSINTLISTVSGEVTVSIEGYTITFAADNVSGAFAADMVGGSYQSDYIEAITWQH